jgi:transcriptional regulator with XRE-family HTH domain
MQTIGERLEEARKRKGISIREASEATKIRSEYLHKFESNSLDINLPEIYIRGFLRSYAIYLKLNGDKLMADYKALAPSDGRMPKRENREVYGRVDIGASAPQPVAEQVPDAENADGAQPAVAGSPKVRSSAFPASAGASVGATQIDLGLVIKAGVAMIAVILIVAIFFGIRAISSGSPKPLTELKPVPQQSLVLSAIGPVEVQVREDAVDGPIVWRGRMDANDSHSLPKKGKLYLTATAMENLQIEINGRRAPNPHSGRMTVQIP